MRTARTTRKVPEWRYAGSEGEIDGSVENHGVEVVVVVVVVVVVAPVYGL